MESYSKMLRCSLLPGLVAVLLVLQSLFVGSQYFLTGPLRVAEGFTPEGSPLPLPVQGSCTAGTAYEINSVSDLFANFNDLECIFSAGVAPPPAEIPLGFNYGTLIAVLNTVFWSPVANLSYQGDYVVQTQCNQTTQNIGWLSIGGVDVGTAVWYVDDFPWKDNLAEGEYPLGSTQGIVMDFTTDFRKLCPIEGNESPFGLQNFIPFSISKWPINQFIDYSRVVGRDTNDQGLISLNKAYIIPANPQQGAATVLFYATKSFDPTVLPNFANGAPESIIVPVGPNGETVISYNRGAIDAIVPRLNPSDIYKDLNSGVTAFYNYFLSRPGIFNPQLDANAVITANVTNPFETTTTTAAPSSSATTAAP